MIMSRSSLLRMENVLDILVEKIETHIACSIAGFAPNILPCMILRVNIEQRRRGHRWQYGACVLHAG